MRFILGLASGVSGFIASAAVLLWVPHVIRALPLRGSSWAETPIKNLTYGEFGVWLLLVLTLAFALGFTLGRIFGHARRVMITAAALVPALGTWLMFIAASLGLATFAFPIPIAYAAAVYLGARSGGKGRSGEKSRAPT